MPVRSVAIVGAGFSGALLAINLLRHDARIHVQLIERRHAPGRGVAYSTAHPEHLLNVRSTNMSAFPDDPAHFARWHGSEDFARRTDYGRYLAQMLAEAAAGADGRLSLIHGAAIDARDTGDRVVVVLDDGRRLLADTLVLALGNMPPPVPAGLQIAAGTDFITDPWAGPLHERLSPNAPVILLGTGLTAVDVTLALAASPRTGTVTAVSRRGLLPHAHAPVTPAPPLPARPPGTPVALLRHTRERAATYGWRAAVDELRPVTQPLWQAAANARRRQFLRHLRPWWDIHRHRIAPSVADQLQTLQIEGRFTTCAATPLSYAAQTLTIRPRGATNTIDLPAARVINCTGPLTDLARAPDPLIRALLGHKAIRTDDLRLGLDVDTQCRIRAATGEASQRLYAIGPLTRGAFWEINAVPDIRRQAWALARRLTHSEWVGDGL